MGNLEELEYTGFLRLHCTPLRLPNIVLLRNGRKDDQYVPDLLNTDCIKEFQQFVT